MTEGPSAVLVTIARAVIRLSVPAARRAEAEGDLIELWLRRHASGRRDLRRALIRDVASLALDGARRVVRRTTLISFSSGAFGMWQDAGYAVRMVHRHPGTSLSAILTLAIGLGAGTAIFTAVDRLLLRPISFPEPERVVYIEHAPFNLKPGPQIRQPFLDLPEIAAAGTWAPGGANLEGVGSGVRVAAAVVDDGFFEVMAVAPLIGQSLPVPDGTSRYAVLSFDLWQRRFHADPAIAGRGVTLNGRDYVITGVMPREFTFPGRTEVWLPPYVDLQVTGSAYIPEAIARIAPDVPFTQAAAAVASFGRQHGYGDGDETMAITPLGRELTAQVRPTLSLLAACVALLLVVVCASVSNLLLARVATRHQELTVRRALGASRWRIMRQLMIEAILLALCGAALGAVAASWMLQSLRAIAPALLADLTFGAVDPRLLASSVALAVLVALLFGAAPGLAASGHRAVEIVRAGRTEARAPFWRRVRSGLIVGQLAIALILLTASAGAVAALLEVSRIDAGFGNPRSVAMIVTLPQSRFAASTSITTFFERAQERLAAVPGVRRVAATGILPGSAEPGSGFELTVPGRTPVPGAPRVYASHLSASPEYFEAAGIRLVAGRGFERTDRVGAPPVIVLSEMTARGLFPDEPRPVGRRVAIVYPRADRQRVAVEHEVVGIAADVRMRTLTGNSVRSLRQAYVPLLQRPPFGNLAFVAEVNGRPADAVESLRAAMAEVDATTPVFNAEPVNAALDRYLAPYRLAGTLISGFAVMTLLVAAIGLYGLIAHLVADRSREIGIRIALGADPYQVRRRFVAHGAMHAFAGVVLGVAGAYAAMHLLGSVIPAFEPPAAWTLGVNGGVLLAIAVAATWLPTSRVIRIDPVAAIRD